MDKSTADGLEQHARILLYTVAGALLGKAGLDISMAEPVVNVLMWGGAGLLTWVGTWTWWKKWNGARTESVSTVA